ncbi:MAG: hypothetical protein CR977_00230 [Gammaproteobacteria bacterium]|nr:MAG: hypothetical protein CR977_00230 [Gammaproteobacteria bacterium]
MMNNLSISPLKRRKFQLYLGYGVALLSLLSLFFLTQATEGSQKFERFYQPLLLTIIIGIVGLLTIVIVHLYNTFRNYRQALPGASLSLTILWRTLLLAFIPLFFISFFAFKFLRYEFQSSFDRGINDALNNSLVLSQQALDVRALQALRDSRAIAQLLANYDYLRLQSQLEAVRREASAFELTVLDEKGFIQAFASTNLSTIIPLIPEHSDFIRVENEGGIFVLESDSTRFQIRTLVTIDKPGAPNYYLQAVFHIPDTVSALAAQVNKTISERDRFNYLMPRVNRSFIFVLILVVLLAGLLLILSSIGFANDMAQPIRELIGATKAVSQGNFNRSLLVRRHDDFGTLMQSFNRMTHSLKTATEEAEHHRNRVESERAYLATVINHMTAAVLTLDYQYRLQTYNERAENLLKADLEPAVYCDLVALDLSLEPYKNLVNQVMQRYVMPETDESALAERHSEIEVEIDLNGNTKTFMASITPLPSTDALHGGYVLIFDEIGEYLQQQKQAAWEEVSRRLAHEIKNPLTPILLAAERLNYKLSGHLGEKEQRVLSRSIDVISKQVKSLKNMVDDFSDYAKPLTAKKTPLPMNALLKDVFDLYRGHYPGIHFHLDIQAKCDTINGNANVLRQVLHNLIKNAIEACESRSDNTPGEITVSSSNKNASILIYIKDNGIGLPSNNSNVFDPYVTTKEKGTGLGLAIVKKVVQEHHGEIELQHRAKSEITANGTVAIIQLPLLK